MVTAADLRRRLESFEGGPGAQKTKIFFIDKGSRLGFDKGPVGGC